MKPDLNDPTCATTWSLQPKMGCTDLFCSLNDLPWTTNSNTRPKTMKSDHISKFNEQKYFTFLKITFVNIGNTENYFTEIWSNSENNHIFIEFVHQILDLTLLKSAQVLLNQFIKIDLIINRLKLCFICVIDVFIIGWSMIMIQQLSFS